jgi:hypothetical protein
VRSIANKVFVGFNGYFYPIQKIIECGGKSVDFNGIMIIIKSQMYIISTYSIHFSDYFIDGIKKTK